MRQIFILIFIAGPFASLQLAADEIRFNRDVRPILSETCFVCHGPDEAQLQAGLRLDLRDKAIAQSDSGQRRSFPVISMPAIWSPASPATMNPNKCRRLNLAKR